MNSTETTVLDIRICNCAQCGKELLGRKQPRGALIVVQRNPELPRERAAGKIDGRPYCLTCLDGAHKSQRWPAEGLTGRQRGGSEDSNPGADNALRALEGD